MSVIRASVVLHQQERDAILATIRTQAAAAPGSMLGVGTGWSGPKTLLDEDTLGPLRLALAHIGMFTLGQSLEWCAWANIMRRGDRIDWHAHEKSHLGGRNAYSGVFYLAAPDGSGLFRYHNGEREFPLVDIVPREGDLLVFPATLAHLVTMHQSDHERISIAFNGRRA